MNSDAPLIGLSASLINHCLALDILLPFLDISVCAVIKENALEKFGFAPEFLKFMDSIDYHIAEIRRKPWGNYLCWDVMSSKIAEFDFEAGSSFLLN